MMTTSNYILFLWHPRDAHEGYTFVTGNKIAKYKIVYCVFRSLNAILLLRVFCCTVPLKKNSFFLHILVYML